MQYSLNDRMKELCLHARQLGKTWITDELIRQKITKMKIKAYIITKDKMNYPDAPNYSTEFDVNSVEDLVSYVATELYTFKGIYPDSITIFAYDDDSDFEHAIFEYETEKKNDKLTNVMDDLLSKIRKIELENLFK